MTYSIHELKKAVALRAVHALGEIKTQRSAEINTYAIKHDDDVLGVVERTNDIVELRVNSGHGL